MQEEEIGLRGAFALDPSLLTGKVLLNLDTEEAGEVYIGCAGAAIYCPSISIQPIDAPAGLRESNILPTL